MLHSKVVHNGRLQSLDEVCLSPGQAGLFNGWGLFTTMRIYSGVPFAFERHWRRLSIDAERTSTPLPFVAGDVLADLRELISANGVEDGTARLYFTNNLAGPWRSDEQSSETDCLICTSDLPARPEPARLTVQEHGRHAAHPLAGTKVLAWLPNNWLLAKAHRDGYDESILLNERGEVSECTSANVFVVAEGTALTPPLSSGCLPGVTREVVLELGGSVSPPVREQVLTLPDVLAADEVFITSTTREVLPVRQVAGVEIASCDGPVTRALAKAFEQRVAEYTARN